MEVKGGGEQTQSRAEKTSDSPLRMPKRLMNTLPSFDNNVPLIRPLQNSGSMPTTMLAVNMATLWPMRVSSPIVCVSYRRQW